MGSLRRRLALAAPAACAVVAGVAAAPAAAVSVPWCGTGEPTTDLPDAVSAYEWHVIYALPDGTTDRFASFAARFDGDAATVSSWWAGQDPTRRPRWDLLDTPGCADDYGRLDISLARVPAGVTTFESIIAALRSDGFANPDKGYLVYFDGTPHAGDEYGVCGEGSVDSIAFAYAIVFLQTCNQVASDDSRALIAAHEMTHGMGAVPTEAPHYCNDGHVCDSPSDLMKAQFDSRDSLASLSLDVGRDDYYGHMGSWWDVRDSGLLYDLDDPRASAPDILRLTATNVGSSVVVRWAPSVAEDDVYYRLYDETGKLLNDDLGHPRFTAVGSLGQVLTWTIRASDDAGFLSRPATIHFKVGYGIVDANGVLVQDTVKPAAVRRVRATVTGATVILRWSAVADPVGLRGYRVAVAGGRPVVVSGTTTSLPLARAHGHEVTVAAVDRAGNVGPSASVRVR